MTVRQLVAKLIEVSRGNIESEVQIATYHCEAQCEVDREIYYDPRVVKEEDGCPILIEL